RNPGELLIEGKGHVVLHQDRRQVRRRLAVSGESRELDLKQVGAKAIGRFPDGRRHGAATKLRHFIRNRGILLAALVLVHHDDAGENGRKTRVIDGILSVPKGEQDQVPPARETAGEIEHANRATVRERKWQIRGNYQDAPAILAQRPLMLRMKRHAASQGTERLSLRMWPRLFAQQPEAEFGLG